MSHVRSRRPSVALRVGACLTVFLMGLCGLPTAFAPASRLTGRAAQHDDPLHETLQFVARATRRDLGRQPERQLESGTAMLDVSDGFQHVALARREADGRVTVACVGSLPEAEAFLRGEADGLAGGRADDHHDHDQLPNRDIVLPPTRMQVGAATGPAAKRENAQGSTIIIRNQNDPGVGFNDPAPATPVGGNPGTTLGQQRLNVFQRAAEIWGATLRSNVPIVVAGQFTSLPSGVLGSAGTTSIFRGFPNAPFGDTWYHYALANALADQDLAPQEPPRAQINTNFSTNFTFYLGLDNNAPPDQVDLLTVVLHEFAHGLGFSTFVNSANGRNAGASDENPDGGFTDCYARLLRDENLNLNWNQMTAAQRQASAINTGNLTWTGATTQSALPVALEPSPVLRIERDPPVTFAVNQATFGGAITLGGLTRPLIAAQPPLACGALSNPGAVNGNLALVDRGDCPFVDKAFNAQQAGAQGVIIANNVAGGFIPGGTAANITIPVAGISQADGATLRGFLSSGSVTATLRLDPTRLAGTTNGRLRMFAPNPRQAGSSVSHWDNTVQPRLLMEPAITPLLPRTQDLTLNLLRDIGWTVNPIFSASGIVVPAGGSGGSRSVAINAVGAWTLSGIPDWVTGFPAAGNLLTPVSFQVAPNPGAQRVATLTLNPGGNTFTIVQNGVTGSCGYAIAPTSATVAATGASGSVAVTTGAGCAWTATSNIAWTTITSGASGSGNGAVGYTVAANTGPARSGTLTIAGQTFTISQAGGCAFGIAPTSVTAAAGGASGSVAVTAGASCGWTATSNVAWATITSGASGSGNGTVGYTVATNTGPARSGTLTIAGQTFTISQAGGCAFGIAPASVTVAAGGASGSVAVTAGAGCGWTATSNTAWATITSGASGSGNGAVGYTVAANPGAARSGTLTIAGQTFTISQAGGCASSITPTSVTVAAGGASGSVAVTADAGCGWTATSNAPWATITSGASGSGNGTVGYTVAANTGPVRSGTLTIAGQTFTISQAGGCAFSLAPPSVTVAAGGASGSVAVTTDAGCGWAATSNVAWATITSGVSGAGNGVVGYTVSANPGAARNGTLTIAGQAFTISQAGADAGCSVIITPLSVNVSGEAIPTVALTVTTGSSCAWEATVRNTDAPWIKLISAQLANGQVVTPRMVGQLGDVNRRLAISATGSATLAFAVGRNPAATPRTGTFFVAGQVVTVTQAGSLGPSAPVGSTMAMFRPSNGFMYLKNQLISDFADNDFFYGIAGDAPIAGDWDGDGIDTPGIYRNVNGAMTFFLINNNTGGFADVSFAFGGVGDIPIAGDWDGDGTVTVGVYRPSAQTFFLRNALAGGNPDLTVTLTGAQATDLPIAGRWTAGSNVTGLGLYRPSTGRFLLKNANASGPPDASFVMTTTGTFVAPVAGDWTRQGFATVGVVTNVGGTIQFQLRNSNTSGGAEIRVNYGVPGDVPLIGNWDGQPKQPPVSVP